MTGHSAGHSGISAGHSDGSALPERPIAWTIGTRQATRGGPAEPDPRLRDGPDGYRVVAVKLGQGWRYVAWGPEECPALSYWAWAQQRHDRVHYGIGEHVPTRSQRLGTYGTAAQAMAACMAHRAGEPLENPASALQALGAGDGMGQRRGEPERASAAPPGVPRSAGRLPRQGELAL
jgi:hypothetical protein